MVHDQWQGICYYRRWFSLQPEEAGKRLWLDFEGAMHITDPVMARHTVKTPGEVSALQISYFESGKPAAKNDLLIVYVSLVDKDGTLVFGENRREVTLHTQKTWTLE